MGYRGDFNDIKNKEEKKGGRERVESSFQNFRNFIDKMEIGDIGTRVSRIPGQIIDKMRATSRND